MKFGGKMVDYRGVVGKKGEGMDLIKTHCMCIYISQMIMKLKQKLGKATDKLFQSIINTSFWESLTSDVY